MRPPGTWVTSISSATASAKAKGRSDASGAGRLAGVACPTRSVPLRHDAADGGHAPTELSEQLDEVRPEPLIHDLARVVEAKREQERSLHVAPRCLLHEQPGALLCPPDVIEHDRHVVIGDDPTYVRLQIREGSHEPSGGADHRRVRRVIVERGEVVLIEDPLN